MRAGLNLLVVLACAIAATVSARRPQYRWLGPIFAAGGVIALIVMIGMAIAE